MSHQVVIAEHLPVALQLVGACLDMAHVGEADAGSLHSITPPGQPVLQCHCPASDVACDIASIVPLGMTDLIDLM